MSIKPIFWKLFCKIMMKSYGSNWLCSRFASCYENVVMTHHCSSNVTSFHGLMQTLNKIWKNSKVVSHLHQTMLKCVHFLFPIEIIIYFWPVQNSDGNQAMHDQNKFCVDWWFVVIFLWYKISHDQNCTKKTMVHLNLKKGIISPSTQMIFHLKLLAKNAKL